MSRMLGCGPSKLMADGLPIMTSMVPERPLVQPDGAIAARTIFSFGEARTSATLRCPATWISMPVETSDCGSRSTTSVRRPFANAADASPSVTVVFPTPPLRELTLSTCTTATLPLLVLENLTVCCVVSTPARKVPMFRKILVANRGEIAIRAFRAAYELGAETVAVFPYEDRNSMHRLKADEAYQIGEPGHPVRAYLDVQEIIRVAQESGADAIYPGYGFLSENPDLADAARAAGIAFIGPRAEVLEMAGNKVTAKEHAIAAGVPVLQSTPPSRDIEELLAGADAIGFPIFAKAVAGGGGRGMRRVNSKDDLRAALEEAMREADSAFGDPTMFLEQAVLRPRHIEVQVLADASGETVHLFERDCSVQRRHQKVIEIAPAPNLSDDIRQALYRDAIAFARSIGYENAGTVEFLLDTAGERAGQHVFIEMNPRIQVEHTVTEEITDVDLVQSQMRIAAGESLADLGLEQSSIRLRGAALQCRITTEDPTAGFRPDTGKITTYRSPGGAGIRLDGGTINPGAQISPHFDSMLAKLTCRGRDYTAAVARAKRALAEFRIRGVSTNIPFLQAVLDDADFAAGNL